MNAPQTCSKKGEAALPLISVIIPNYNHARYLDERIQSVLNQTYQNFEVIILDDCSTDNSVEVIERYRNNPHVSNIIYNETNSGKIFSQWHKGMELAQGKLVWIAESDDKCEVELLASLVKAIQDNPDCVVAFCGSKSFGEKIPIETDMNIYGVHEGYYGGKEFIGKFLSRGTVIGNASSAIFRKEVALAIPRSYMEFKGAGDRMFWTLMAENGGVFYIEKKLNHYRLHPNNSTKRNYAMGINQREDWTILNYIYRKGYITRKFYNMRRKKYSWAFIFRGLPKGELQTELLHLYGYGFWGIQWLRLKSFLKMN